MSASTPKYLTAALYKFVSLPNYAALQPNIHAACEAHQIKGTILLAAGLIKYLDFGDDDEETDKKREERYNDYLKMGGDPTINIENPMFDLPKDGDVIGSLAFLPPKKKEFLIQSGLAQEYSQYDAKKNRWISFIADRAAVSKQIAGAVARRIVNYLKEGMEVKQGEEMGFIKFGSRVDVLLPVNAKVKVQLGEAVKGGVTVLAEW